MKHNRLSLLCAVALAFGCSAGVKGQTGSGGSIGNWQRWIDRHRQAAAAPPGAAPTAPAAARRAAAPPAPPTPAWTAHARRRPIGAHPVPLDLYFLMDSSKSMLENDRRRNDEVGRGQHCARHVLRRFGLSRARRCAQVLPRRAERRPRDLRTELRLRELRPLRLPRHLRFERGDDDGGRAALPNELRLRKPEPAPGSSTAAPEPRTTARTGSAALPVRQRPPMPAIARLVRPARSTPATAICATSAPAPITRRPMSLC